jgi:hypothetical protein
VLAIPGRDHGVDVALDVDPGFPEELVARLTGGNGLVDLWRNSEFMTSRRWRVTAAESAEGASSLGPRRQEGQAPL